MHSKSKYSSLIKNEAKYNDENYGLIEKANNWPQATFKVTSFRIKIYRCYVKKI
jgi:hypothetical protein